MRPDYRLYLIVSASTAPERVEAALEGGVTVLQLREKELPLGRTLEAGRLLRRLTRERGVPFIVNDRVDLAQVLEADGVHLGQDDLPVPAARRLLGQGAIIGLSAGTPQEARAGERQGASYLGVGSVFPTPSKPEAGQPIGPEGLRRVAGATSLPVVGIGGITAERAGEVVDAGARGVAVISAILAASDTREAAHRLREVLDERLTALETAGGRR